MPTLEDYVFAMEAAPAEDLAGSGLAVLAAAVTAGGTSGVATPEPGLALPVPVAVGAASWRPVGACRLPGLEGSAATALWRPAWGSPDLPLPLAWGAARLPLKADAVLPPLFFLGLAGGLADMVLPSLAGLAVSSPDRHAAGSCSLPLAVAEAWACGLERPVENAAGSDAVVALLGQGNPSLALAGAALVQGASGDDAVAGAMLASLASNLTYVADAAGGERWTCAMGTYARGSGDCEDGAILLHGLLLAVGLPMDRLVTAFGRAGIDRRGHAWVAYRRRVDDQWVALDWTAAAVPAGVAGLPRLVDDPSYVFVDYALTSQAFFPVRQAVAAFFARVVGDGLCLPAAVAAAWAALGANATCALAAAWLRGQGRAGSLGRVALPRPLAAASAGSVAASLALPPCTGQGCLGAAAASNLPVCGLAAVCCGNGQGHVRLVRADLTGAAGQAALVSGAAGLARARLVGSGLAGSQGMAAAGLPRPRLAAWAWPGQMAWGSARLGLLLPAASGGPVLAGGGAAAVPPWRAVGRGGPHGAALETWTWDTSPGEAWP